MGLDVRVKLKEKIFCPECGEEVAYVDKFSEISSGKGWYPFLKSIGYYVPLDEVTEENNWYGEDMILSDEEVVELDKFLRDHEIYNSTMIRLMLTSSDLYSIAINADW